jgi:hypothetical protein
MLVLLLQFQSLLEAVLQLSVPQEVSGLCVCGWVDTSWSATAAALAGMLDGL